MYLKLKKIFRILFPINILTQKYFEKRISWLPDYKEHKIIENVFLIKFNSGRYLAMRDFNHSDIMVYNQIFIYEEYKIVFEILDQFKLDLYKIIDAGANVGYTSIYFAGKFPKTRIIAIEPCPQNIKLINKNIKINNLQEIISFQSAALSSDSSKFFLNSNNFRDHLDWSNTTVEDTNGEIRSITINEIVSNENWGHIDLLKIDIEGYEREIFNSKCDLNFLKITKVIAIEIHDEIASRIEIELILKQNNFLLINSGELTIGINKCFLN